jgi:hypothetical protein
MNVSPNCAIAPNRRFLTDMNIADYLRTVIYKRSRVDLRMNPAKRPNHDLPDSNIGGLAVACLANSSQNTIKTFSRWLVGSYLLRQTMALRKYHQLHVGGALVSAYAALFRILLETTNFMLVELQFQPKTYASNRFNFHLNSKKLFTCAVVYSPTVLAKNEGCHTFSCVCFKTQKNRAIQNIRGLHDSCRR